MDNNHLEWRPITLTLVEYPKGKQITHTKIETVNIFSDNFHAGDLLGFLLAWASLSPLAIMAGFVALILFRRDLHTVR